MTLSNPITLFTIVSGQVMPQIKTVTHLRPKRLVLLHSKAPESEGTASRLKTFFDSDHFQHHLALPKDAQWSCVLKEIPDNDYTAICNRVSLILTENKSDDVMLNFTGGNKLMSTGAFAAASALGVPCCYLERRDELSSLIPKDGTLLTTTEKINRDACDGLDAIEVMRCQGGGALEIKADRVLVATSKLAECAQSEVQRRLTADQSLIEFLGVQHGIPIPLAGNQAGDSWELNTAAAILFCGVRQVCHSVHLRSAQTELNELDLVFLRHGVIWVVECKDRVGAGGVLRNVKNALNMAQRRIDHRLYQSAENGLRDLKKRLSIAPLHQLSSKLNAARTFGGLLGRTLFAPLSIGEGLVEHAKALNIDLIVKSRALKDLAALLE